MISFKMADTIDYLCIFMPYANISNEGFAHPSACPTRSKTKSNSYCNCLWMTRVNREKQHMAQYCKYRWCVFIFYKSCLL